MDFHFFLASESEVKRKAVENALESIFKPLGKKYALTCMATSTPLPQPLGLHEARVCLKLRIAQVLNNLASSPNPGHKRVIIGVENYVNLLGTMFELQDTGCEYKPVVIGTDCFAEYETIAKRGVFLVDQCLVVFFPEEGPGYECKDSNKQAVKIPYESIGLPDNYFSAYGEVQTKTIGQFVSSAFSRPGAKVDDKDWFESVGSPISRRQQIYLTIMQNCDAIKRNVTRK